MRTCSWIFLVVSFLTGLVSAFVVAYYTFDAKPIEVYDPGPTVKILVSKKDIPRGAEVTAEAIVFEDAPVAELPEAVLTSFAQVYRRRAAWPIPEGYPVCEDFLLSVEESASKENTYLPAGSKIVSLEVEQLRQGGSVSELLVPITTYLSADQKIDIKAVPREEPCGLYVQRRQELLKKHTKDAPEDGQFVLQDVVIHQIAEGSVDDSERRIQTLSLLLDEEDAEKLMTAARNSHLRVIPHVLDDGDEPETIVALEATETPETPGDKTGEPDVPEIDETETVEKKNGVAVIAFEAPDDIEVADQNASGEATVSFVTPSVVREASETSENEEVVQDATPTPVAEMKAEEEPCETTKIATESEVVVKRSVTPKSAKVLGGTLLSGRAEENKRSSEYSPFDTKTRSARALEPEPTDSKQETENLLPPLRLRSRSSSEFLY